MMKNFEEVRKNAATFSNPALERKFDRVEIAAERDALIEDYKELELEITQKKDENRALKKEIEELNMYVESLEATLGKRDVEQELIKMERSIAVEEREIWKAKALSLIKKSLEQYSTS